MTVAFVTPGALKRAEFLTCSTVEFTPVIKIDVAGVMP